jgi:prevent-host-death family protein
MKSIQISEDILPLANFKTQASRVLKRMQKSNRPVVITLNGTPAAVMITPEEFDRWTERQRFLEAVNAGAADLARGEVLSDEEVKEQLEAEFGALEE